MVVPTFSIRGPQDLHLILTTILVSMAVELAIVAAIWLRYREKAAPFLVAGFFIALQMATMGLLKDWPVLHTLLSTSGQLPSAIVTLTGFIVGGLTSWFGWQAGKQSAPTRYPAMGLS